MILPDGRAACVPLHRRGWLNDLSSMPPVSVTMQALNLAAVDALPDELGLLDELPAGRT